MAKLVGHFASRNACQNCFSVCGKNIFHYEFLVVATMSPPWLCHSTSAIE
jgi:hypothetical protein